MTPIRYLLVVVVAALVLAGTATAAPRHDDTPDYMTTQAIETDLEERGLRQLRPRRRILEVLDASCVGKGYPGATISGDDYYRKFVCYVTTPRRPFFAISVKLGAAGGYTWRSLYA